MCFFLLKETLINLVVIIVARAFVPINHLCVRFYYNLVCVINSNVISFMKNMYW